MLVDPNNVTGLAVGDTFPVTYSYDADSSSIGLEDYFGTYVMQSFWARAGNVNFDMNPNWTTAPTVIDISNGPGDYDAMYIEAPYVLVSSITDTNYAECQLSLVGPASIFSGIQLPTTAPFLAAFDSENDFYCYAAASDYTVPLYIGGLVVSSALEVTGNGQLTGSWFGTLQRDSADSTPDVSCNARIILEENDTALVIRGGDFVCNEMPSQWRDTPITLVRQGRYLYRDGVRVGTYNAKRNKYQFEMPWLDGTARDITLQLMRNGSLAFADALQAKGKAYPMAGTLVQQ